MLSRGYLSREQGFTLIEIFVAMIIAMIILGVVSESYLSGLATQRLESEALRVQESGRFAMDLISRSIRHAGYRNTYTPGAGGAKEFCSATTVSLFDGANDPTTQTINGTPTAIANSSDVLILRAYGEDNAAGTADGSVIDCLGTPVGRGVLAEETLYVAQDAANANEPTLFCHSSVAAGSPQPLVAGVESMQILYGEDTDDDGVINRYVPSNMITKPDGVFSVMVSLVVRSANPTTRIVEPVFKFLHFNGTDDDAEWLDPNDEESGQVKKIVLPSATTTPATADKRLRRQFDSTIAFRNFSQC